MMKIEKSSHIPFYVFSSQSKRLTVNFSTCFADTEFQISFKFTRKTREKLGKNSEITERKREFWLNSWDSLTSFSCVKKFDSFLEFTGCLARKTHKKFMAT